MENVKSTSNTNGTYYQDATPKVSTDTDEKTKTVVKNTLNATTMVVIGTSLLVTPITAPLGGAMLLGTALVNLFW